MEQLTLRKSLFSLRILMRKCAVLPCRWVSVIPVETHLHVYKSGLPSASNNRVFLLLVMFSIYLCLLPFKCSSVVQS